MAEAIEKADGFAQVFPEHKFHIVDVLQKRGHIVGMTGDGVNDAPALKKADCGIAVSGATDAARAAASIVLLAPGLSVIIDAVKESRRIFQRMNSYAIYRIAETLRVLFFMTLAILVFNFYPVTAVMIVMLALLNDGAILSIAYDNVQYKNKPEAWNMRLVLAISTVLGVIGVVAAFALFYLGERVFHFDRLHIQTLMYLKLSIAGHLTIFLTRTRGPFWSIRPARILWIAVLGTQIIATLLAVYGVFMTPLGWKWAGFVWGYALVWALVNDRVKLLAYKIFDPVKAEPKPDAKAEAKPDAKAESKPEAKTPSDLTPKIAERAYELYEKRAGNDGTAVQDWKKAEQELQSYEAKAEPKPYAKDDALKTDAKADEPKPDAKADQPKPEVKADAPTTDAKTDEPKTDAKADQPKPEVKADAPKTDAKTDEPKTDAKADEPKPDANADEPKPDGKADAPKPDAKADEPKPDAKADQPKPEAKDKTQPDVSPQLVKRVHELYEELGREEVQTVQDWEKAEPERQKNEIKK
jgi:H+-transporting ATPase